MAKTHDITDTLSQLKTYVSENNGAQLMELLSQINKTATYEGGFDEVTGLRVNSYTSLLKDLLTIAIERDNPKHGVVKTLLEEYKTHGNVKNLIEQELTYPYEEVPAYRVLLKQGTWNMSLATQTLFSLLTEARISAPQNPIAIEQVTPPTTIEAEEITFQALLNVINDTKKLGTLLSDIRENKKPVDKDIEGYTYSELLEDLCIRAIYGHNEQTVRYLTKATGSNVNLKTLATDKYSEPIITIFQNQKDSKNFSQEDSAMLNLLLGLIEEVSDHN